MTTLDDLLIERDALIRKMGEVGRDCADRRDHLPVGEARRLERDTEAQLTRLQGELELVNARIDAARREHIDSLLSGTRSADNRRVGSDRYGSPSGPVLLGREQRDGFATWARARYPRQHEQRAELSLGRVLSGTLTGDWTESPDELRAIGEGTSAAGGVLVPSPIASNIIDRARNVARVFQAGAKTIPMDSSTLRVPRLTGEPDPSSKWRNEAATIGEDSLTFDSVTLTAQSLAFYVRSSRELIEDAAAGGGVESVLRNSFAEVVALELDRVALLGSGTAPQPRGLLNQTGVTLIDHGANGSTIATAAMGYDMLIDAIASVRSANFEPNAQIVAPRTEQSLAKLKDTATNYLAPPPGLVPRYATKQVPINITVGTSTDTSYVFTGDWSNLWVGIRTGMSVEVFRERFMDTGQIAFLMWLRADVAVAQPTAFAIDRGVRG